MSDNEYPTVCQDADCDNEISPMEDDSRFATDIGWVCWPCWESAESHASKAYHVVDGEAEAYLVHEYGVFSYEDLEEVDPPPLSRTYKRTDGWRGYYETRPTDEGWTEIEAGWTTGNWGDAIADSKQAFNAWAERVMDGRTILDHPVWIVFDLTSNVFSTAVGVFVPDDVAEPVEPPAL